jgi:hypothetical protein
LNFPIIGGDYRTDYPGIIGPVDRAIISNPIPTIPTMALTSNRTLFE